MTHIHLSYPPQAEADNLSFAAGGKGGRGPTASACQRQGTGGRGNSTYCQTQGEGREEKGRKNEKGREGGRKEGRERGSEEGGSGREGGKEGEKKRMRRRCSPQLAYDSTVQC